MVQQSNAGPMLGLQAGSTGNNSGGPSQSQNTNASSQLCWGNTNAPNVTCFSCGNQGHYVNTCPIVNSGSTGANLGVTLRLAAAPQPVAAHAALGNKGGLQGSSLAMCVLPMLVVDQVNVAWQDKGKALEKQPVVPGAGVQKRTGRIQPSDTVDADLENHIDQSQDDTTPVGDSQTISLTEATHRSDGRVTKLVPIQPWTLKLPGLIYTVDDQEYFSVAKALSNTQIVILFRQLLDKSDAIQKELAYLLQSATLWFRRWTQQVSLLAPAGVVAAHVHSALPVTEALDDDGRTVSMFTMSTISSVELSLSLIDSGSVVELVSGNTLKKLCVSGVGVQVHKDEEHEISLADNSRT